MESLTRSRPQSPQTPKLGSRSSTPKEAFRPGGSMKYKDAYLTPIDGMDLPSMGRPSTRERDRLRANISPLGWNVEDDDEFEEQMKKLVEWDESGVKEAERIVRSLRISLRDTRHDLAQANNEKKKLQEEAIAMQELFQERRQVAEDALQAVERMKGELVKHGLADESTLSNASIGSDYDKNWRQDRARIGDQLKSLEEENAQYKASIEQANMEKQKALDGHEIVMTEMKSLQSVLDNANKSISELTLSLSEREQELSSTKDSLKEKETIISQHESHIQARLKDGNAELALAIDSLTAEKATLTSQLTSIEMKKGELESQLLDKDNEISSLKSRWDTMQSDLDDENGSLEKLAKFNELEATLSSLQVSLQEKDKFIENKENEVLGLKDHIHKLDEQIIEKNKINLDYTELVKELQQELSDARITITERDADIVKEKDNKMKMEQIHIENIANLTSKHEEIDKQHASVVVEKDMEIEFLNTQLKDLKTTFQTLQSDHDDQSVSLMDTESTVKALQSELSAVRQQHKEDMANKDRLLLEWEQKMSLFEILQDYEKEAKATEEQYKVHIASLNARIESLIEEKNNYFGNWKYWENCSSMLQSDSFYLDLLVQSREKVASLEIQLNMSKMAMDDILKEMKALNSARDLEQVEYETKLRVSFRDTVEQLRQLIAQKTISETLLKSLLSKLELHSENQQSMYTTMVHDRDRIIHQNEQDILGLKEDIKKMQAIVFDKETVLVRALSENEDYRIKEIGRKRHLKESLDSSLENMKQQLQSHVMARAPRLRMQQLEACLQKSEEKALLWEKLAQEYMYENQLDYDKLNNEGYLIDLPVFDGGIDSIKGISQLYTGATTNMHDNSSGVGAIGLAGMSGICIQTLCEQNICSMALHLIHTLNVTDDTLEQFKKYITDNGITEEVESRALARVKLSWSTLESLCNLRNTFTQEHIEMERIRANVIRKIKEDARDNHNEIPTNLQLKEDIKYVNLIDRKMPSFSPFYYEELEQRLFTLFEMGTVTESEFYGLCLLQDMMKINKTDIVRALTNIGLSFNELVEICIQHCCDQHEVNIAKDSEYDLTALYTTLSSLSSYTDGTFLMKLAEWREEMFIAQQLREEYFILRSSFNQTQIQLKLLSRNGKNGHVQRLSARERDSARERKREQASQQRMEKKGVYSSMRESGKGTVDDASKMQQYLQEEREEKERAAKETKQYDQSKSNTHSSHNNSKSNTGSGNGKSSELNTHKPLYAADHSSKTASTIRTALKEVIHDERYRRLDEQNSRQSDISNTAQTSLRNSRLMIHTNNNLNTLELDLAETAHGDEDQARLVFTKMLRSRLNKEVNMKNDVSKTLSRMDRIEKVSENYLTYLEEALMSLSTHHHNDNNNDSENNSTENGPSMVNRMVSKHILDLQSRISESNLRLETILSTMMESRLKEVEENQLRYRQLESELIECKEKLAHLRASELQRSEEGRGENDDDFAAMITTNHSNLNQNTDVDKNDQADIWSETDVSSSQTLLLHHIKAIHISMREIRKKDAALERIAYLYELNSNELLEQKYNDVPVQILKASLIRLDEKYILNGNALGRTQGMVSAVLKWNNAMIPSINTLVQNAPSLQNMSKALADGMDIQSINHMVKEKIESEQREKIESSNPVEEVKEWEGGESEIFPQSDSKSSSPLASRPPSSGGNNHNTTIESDSSANILHNKKALKTVGKAALLTNAMGNMGNKNGGALPTNSKIHPFDMADNNGRDKDDEKADLLDDMMFPKANDSAMRNNSGNQANEELLSEIKALKLDLLDSMDLLNRNQLRSEVDNHHKKGSCVIM